MIGLLSFTKKMIFPTFVFTTIGFSYFKLSNFLSYKKLHSLAKAEFPIGEIPNYFDDVDIERIIMRYPNLTVLRSNAVESLIGKLRDINTSREQFRFISRRIIRYIIEEALASECDQEVIKQSPLGNYKTKINPRDINDYVAISIMRSGNGMVEEIMTICPEINIGKILLQRDENTQDKKPIFFYEKVPKRIENKRIFVLDPMLGTGGSVIACISVLKDKGVKEENIIFLNLISCEDGLNAVFKKFPKVKIITAKIDQKLLPNKYIAPGMGDFGDRFYGTDE
jgi:uracil phosphoribosyltransferase